MQEMTQAWTSAAAVQGSERGRILGNRADKVVRIRNTEGSVSLRQRREESSILARLWPE